MQFLKATTSDIQSILDLQRKNLIQHLTNAEQQDGFLSVEFTAAQLEKMNNESGIIVCKENDIVYGYLCTSLLAFNKSFELPATMIGLYNQLQYRGKLLADYHAIIVGPWCIERESRGKNIFINLWHALNDMLANDIDLLTTFISIKNTRSLAAAKKVGMEEVTIFEFKHNQFSLLVKTNK